MAWRKDLPEDLKAKIKDAIVNMPEEEFKKIGKESSTGYVEVEDSDWDVIRKCAEVLELDLEGMN